MKVSLHLISMPWARPLSPSIQLGALKAYLRNSDIPDLDIQAYHAHFLIPFLSSPRSFHDFFGHCEVKQEYAYSLLLIRDFVRSKSGAKASIKSLLKGVNPAGRREPVGKTRLTMNDLNKLREGTEKFIEDYLVPKLSRDGINLIGFTLNFHQVLASAYVMAYLTSKHPEYRFRFICGGSSAAVPRVVEMLRHLNLSVIFILGEGEIRLESLCRSISVLPPDCDEAALNQAILAASPGIFDSLDMDDIRIKDLEDFKAESKTQIQDISTSPIPDFTEFFEMLRNFCDDEEVYQELKSETRIPVEGSRGCFAHCAFCGLNNVWGGFRAIQPEKVVKRCFAVIEAYGLSRILFVDNVCDTWAEGYADHLIQAKLQLPAFMELRAHHPEVFWTKLALSGVNEVQIGIEAVAPGILKAIGKGTRVIQNLAVQKYLTELNIQSNSNLITYYPGATVDDVLETRRVLELSPHLPRFFFSKFMLSLGSPLFEKMPIEQRRGLKPYVSVKFPKSLALFSQEFWIMPPSEWVSGDAEKAWRDFVRWYEKFKKINNHSKPDLRVKRMPGGCLVVVDTRGGKFQEIPLDRKSSIVLDICHAPTKPELIEKNSGLDKKEVAEALDSLIQRKLIVLVDGECLSLPLRPRNELIRNYHEAAAKKHRGLVPLDGENAKSAAFA